MITDSQLTISIMKKDISLEDIKTKLYPSKYFTETHSEWEFDVNTRNFSITDDSSKPKGFLEMVTIEEEFDYYDIVFNCAYHNKNYINWALNLFENKQKK